MKTLDQIKDELAVEHFKAPEWCFLNDSQRALFVDLVATEYALQQVNEVSKKHLAIVEASL